MRPIVSLQERPGFHFLWRYHWAVQVGTKLAQGYAFSPKQAGTLVNNAIALLQGLPEDEES